MKKTLLFSLCALFTMLTFAQGNIGIVGPAANGWPDAATNPTPDIMLTNNGDGTHFIAGLTLSTGPAKFRTDMDWGNPSYGGNTFPTGSITANDIPVQAGVYDILVDLNNNTYSFTDVSPFTDIELAGTAVTGGSNPQMSTVDGVTYELAVTNFIMGDLQFRETGTATVYGDTAFPTGTATQGGASIPMPGGFYLVTYNFSTGDYSFSIPDVGIVGPAANGWPDPNNATDILMNTIDGDTYTLDGQVLTDGPIKFRQNQDWGINWGGTAFPGGVAEPNGSNDIPATAGTYDIVFSRSALTYAFNATASVDDENFAGFKVYPNPSSKVWVFENQNMDIANIKVFDQLGKLVLVSAPDSFTIEVDSKVFKSGLYLAQIQLENGAQKTVKLFKN
ncbi:T9SS type A sorting domain-containing protein [Nonlabens spongiae]|nr:T9SS type A sorting domain-containing protein [Nonlabens spongiae]